MAQSIFQTALPAGWALKLNDLVMMDDYTLTVTGVPVVVPKPVVTMIKDGSWLDNSVWDSGSPPDFTKPIVIPDGRHVQFPQTFIFRDGADVTFGKDVTVECWGSFVIEGTEGAPNMPVVRMTSGRFLMHVANDRNFHGTLAGEDGYDSDPGIYAMCGAILLRGEEVTPHAVVVGKEGTERYFNYGCTAKTGISQGKAQLEIAPVGWKAGDRLLLTDVTGRDMLATLELVDGANVEFSGADTFNADVIYGGVYSGKTRIVNLSRRIQIISADASPADPHHKTHLMVHHHHVHAHIEYVEFVNCGPEGKLGRYPVHAHFVEAEHGGNIKGCSVWSDCPTGSNRGIVIHASNGWVVEKNVVYRAKGHGYFQEAGTEINCSFIDNVDIGGINGELIAHVGQITINGAETKDVTKAATTRYWLRNGQTAIRGNIVYGGVGQYGMVVLQTAIIDPVTKKPLVIPGDVVVENSEVYGPKWGYWSGVNNLVLNNPVGLYCEVTPVPSPASITWKGTPTTPVGFTINNPFFVLNGGGATEDARNYGAQVFANQNSVRVHGGYLGGKVVASIHYGQHISIDLATIFADFITAPTYFQAKGTPLVNNLQTNIHIKDCAIKVTEYIPTSNTAPKKAGVIQLTYPMFKDAAGANLPGAVIIIEGCSGSIVYKDTKGNVLDTRDVNGIFAHSGDPIFNVKNASGQLTKGVYEPTGQSLTGAIRVNNV